MVLVNCCEGIGTGWSTSIPNYNPIEIVQNIKLLMEGKAAKPMKPWYRGFKGRIEESQSKPGYYVVSGIIQKIDARTLEILELPVRNWSDGYKKFLESMTKSSEKNKGIIEVK